MSVDLRKHHRRDAESVPDDDQGEGLLGGRAWTALGAAVILGVIALLGVWLAWSSDDEPAPAAQRPSAGAGPVTTAASGARPCPDLATSSEIPTAPPKAEWKIVYTVALPFSATAGPAVVEGDVARCYAHSPEGALFAAVQIPTRYLVAREGQTVARNQTVPGPGQDTLVATLERRGWAPAQPGQLCQLAGFNFAAYTPERAVLSFASRCGSKLQLTQTAVVWSGQDWVVELQPDGSESATASALPSLAGLIPWGGV